MRSSLQRARYCSGDGLWRLSRAPPTPRPAQAAWTTPVSPRATSRSLDAPRAAAPETAKTWSQTAGSAGAGGGRPGRRRGGPRRRRRPGPMCGRYGTRARSLLARRRRRCAGAAASGHREAGPAVSAHDAPRYARRGLRRLLLGARQRGQRGRHERHKRHVGRVAAPVKCRNGLREAPAVTRGTCACAWRCSTCTRASWRTWLHTATATSSPAHARKQRVPGYAQDGDDEKRSIGVARCTARFMHGIMRPVLHCCLAPRRAAPRGTTRTRSARPAARDLGRGDGGLERNQQQEYLFTHVRNILVVTPRHRPLLLPAQQGRPPRPGARARRQRDSSPPIFAAAARPARTPSAPENTRCGAAPF